ncbi:MAG TPA: mandelate racemase/muconate lactonizing enzyme family protein [Pararobbsia sp.]|nr:mandelate racemase/muconate lactonizing enzyme family protein [Pararobbsia sp.]
MLSFDRTRITHFTISRFVWKRDRVIGDSQVRFDTAYSGTLELHTSDGLTGLGFFFGFQGLPGVDELTRYFSSEVFPALSGQSPFSWGNRQRRPRGGNIRPTLFYLDQAIDQAMWDIQGKALDVPLWQLWGGSTPEVPAYASELGFHLTHSEIRRACAKFREDGFSMMKIKVGHLDIDWDLERLSAAMEGAGPGMKLMIDSNEAWSPKEAIYRLHAFRDAGFSIYWSEDPCLRDDFEGLRRVAEAVPFTHINAGEYLGLRDKRKLIEAGAVDILNVHGHFSDSLRAGWLAAEYGIPVSLGNTPLEIGVHLAAALPEARWLEYSYLNHDHLVKAPVRIEDGIAVAPSAPGHGLELSDRAREELSSPEPSLDAQACLVPPSTSRLYDALA